jgi:hypothetical protein
MHWLFCTHYYFGCTEWSTVVDYFNHWHKAFKFNCVWSRPELLKCKCSILQHVTIKYVWEPPTVKQVLPNQCSPQQLQCPLVCAPPSDKSIKKLTSNTQATVTDKLLVAAPTANSISNRQCLSGQLASLLLAPASCCGRSFVGLPASLSVVLARLLQQELRPASHRYVDLQSLGYHTEDRRH